MEIDTIIILLSSGLAGAVAGGVVSLVSQYLNRKWDRIDYLSRLKISLYSEIIGIGSHYLEKNAFHKLNNDVAKALLVCGNNLKKDLIAFIANVEKVHREIENASKDEDKIKDIIEKSTLENTILHKKVIKGMKDELYLCD